VGPATENADGEVCYVDGEVCSAGNDVQNVMADERRCLRLELRSQHYKILCCFVVETSVDC